MISRLVARKIFSLQGCLEEVNSRPRHVRAENSNGKSVHQARSKRLIQWEWLTVNIVLELAGGGGVSHHNVCKQQEYIQVPSTTHFQKALSQALFQLSQ